MSDTPVSSEDVRLLLASIETLKAEGRALGLKIQDLMRQLDQARSRELHLLDAVKIFASRCDASAEEIAQLGVATVVKGENGHADHVVWNTLDDLVTATNFAMKQQATVAKFRQLKEHFLTHQRAVSAILNQLDALSRKNFLTAVDLGRVRELREDLSQLIRRQL